MPSTIKVINMKKHTMKIFYVGYIRIYKCQLSAIIVEGTKGGPTISISEFGIIGVQVYYVNLLSFLSVSTGVLTIKLDI